MSNSSLTAIKRYITATPERQFWVLQLGYWALVAFISLFSLTLWYGQFSWQHFSHTIAQSVIGILFALPLHWASNRCWYLSVLVRLILVFSTVAVIALLWTLVRMAVFMMLVTDDIVWADFGGWYFGSIFIYLCWAGFYHGLKYARLLQEEHEILIKKTAEAKAQELKTISAQSIARDAKLKMLRYQLNPHFLCNTLNAINGLIEVGQAETAQKMSVQLSKFLRFSLDTNPETRIALEFEIKALNLYLEIEKTRFGDRLKLDFNVTEQAKMALIPSLLLQPIIENSMKHAIAKSEEGGMISLDAQVVDKQLVLMISDTGADTLNSKVKGNSGRGIGLRNIEERLRALFDNNYEFNLTIAPSDGLKTIIKIPFEQQEEGI